MLLMIKNLLTTMTCMYNTMLLLLFCRLYYYYYYYYYTYEYYLPLS